PDPKLQLDDHVQRNFAASGPDQKWFGDITYIRTWEGWLYLAVILDAYSRKVVGWAMADHLRTELGTAALQMALTTRDPAPGLIDPTAGGIHYVGLVYGELLRAHQVRQSVVKPGTCWDSSVAESFFATLKTELIYRQTWPSRRLAKSAVFEFIAGWY